MPRTLKSRLILRSIIAVLFTFVLIFIPAGTLDYWQGWAFMAVIFLPMLFTSFYFYKRDPQLIERRMQTREKVAEQKLLVKFMQPVFFAALAIPGLDRRFGWSRVPLWLEVLSLVLVTLGYVITMWVMFVNSFAARTVQVEANQRVISTGPYRFVRHPMYSGAILMLIFTPIALGSWWALPAFVLVIPMIVFRLLNEEKVLRQQLSGYSNYCLHTTSRLIPSIW